MKTILLSAENILGGLFQLFSKEDMEKKFFEKTLVFEDKDYQGNQVILRINAFNRPCLEQIDKTTNEKYSVQFFGENRTEIFAEALSEFLLWLKDFSLRENELKEDGNVGIYPLIEEEKHSIKETLF
ncbi:hypothetical protein CQA57_05810 [Helicobacter anseris]|uniref:Uncharacterized protein n=1 Tax=Helicobacter anseris TaxID=375926 RepID=A0A3D8J854_9HELI|nr:hypothetical protein [Helicobacter anseris]RDU73041.1 hypothetical protein CQA57_05810 [Helicobacter anseris]